MVWAAGAAWIPMGPVRRAARDGRSFRREASDRGGGLPGRADGLPRPSQEGMTAVTSSSILPGESSRSLTKIMLIAG